MHSGMGSPQNGLGFPIRTSLDHCSVTSSLRLFAGSNVLHRLSTPRHPPCALNDLVMPTRLRLTPKTNQHCHDRVARARSVHLSMGGQTIKQIFQIALKKYKKNSVNADPPHFRGEMRMVLH